VTDSKIQRYEGPTLTEAQFDEVVQTMSVAKLTVEQRSSFLWHYAKRYGLDPLTKPFDLIPSSDGQKLIIYANRTASDQLRKLNNLSDRVVYKGPLVIGDTTRDDVYMVEVEIKNPEGRTGTGIGLVGIVGLTDEALANAIMKCHTKALRRGTLGFAGLGMPDESEVDAISTPPKPTTTTSSTLPGPRALPSAKPPTAVS
jgi:hypothetical protein